MYNILLTDDEQIVTDSLAFILEKNFQGQINIFKAHFGTDAINICRTEKIDIIFMDINMPGINGLDAIGEIKKFNPTAVIIILSAFDRFQYAQEAMALGAFRYLTKPVNRNLVVQVVRNAMGIIDSLQGKISSDIEMKEKLSFVSSIVESDFIYTSIYNNHDSESDIQRYLEYFKIKVSSYFFLCIEVGNLSSGKRYDSYLLIRDALITQAPCIVGPFMGEMIIAFVPIENESDSALMDISQQEMVRQVFSIISIKVGANLKIGAGLIYSDLKETVLAYNSSLNALNSIQDKSGLNFAANPLNANKKVTFDSESCERKLILRIQAGDISGTKSQLQLWLDSLFTASVKVDSIRNSAFRVLVTARNLAASIQKGYESQPSFDNTFSILMGCNTVDDFLDYLNSQLCECASIHFNEQVKKENPIIEKAKTFIDQNIDKEISLDQTADFVGMNPFYLSKLFKDETGGNFIDYVNERRLEKAKELLKNGDLTMKEISYQCGYSDQNYFSKIFRRHFGLTPTEFKKSVSIGTTFL